MKALGCHRMIIFLLFLYGYVCVLPSICQAAPKLIFSNRKDILLVDTSKSERNTSVLIPNLVDAAAIDFLYAIDSEGNDRSTYCWTTTPGIFCATAPHLDKPTNIVSSGLDEPDGLAIDWVTGKLYWVDAGTESIEVCVLSDGSHRKILYYTDVDQPRALSLDPARGYIYWTDWGSVAKIERAGMNGDLTTRSTIIGEDLSWPNGLTIDYVERRLYWIDASLSYIKSSELDGTNRTTIKKGSMAHPFAITLYKDQLYWTDWKNKSVFTCPKTDCSRVSKVRGNLYGPMDIDVFEPNRQAQIENPCAVNNGGCSHLCLLAPAGTQNCACPTGRALSADNKTCAEVQEMIFLSRRFDLRTISLDTPDFTDVIINVKDVTHTIAIDYDPVRGYVYWTDDELRVIQRAKLDGSDQQAIVSAELRNPDGVAVDWVAGNLFWTDTGTDRIEVARLDGSSRRVIISDDLDEPRAIIVEPVNGLIYWTDWGLHAKIECASMDGSNRKVVVNESLTWPNGIAIDYEYMRLYWADAKYDKIERSNLDGSDRTTMLQDPQMPHIFGFDVSGDYIYWTDWQLRTIERTSKITPDSPRQLLVDQLPDLMSIRVLYMTSNSSITNGCAENNGGCSHLCLNTPEGLVCACPMGMELDSDNKKCERPDAFILFSQPKNIKRASIEYKHKDTSLPIQYLQNITALDIHIHQERIYFSDNVNGSIRHASINGSAVGVVLKFSNKEAPSSMVVDWISNNLYFIDDNMKIIEVYNIDRNARKVVVWKSLGDPRSIGLHPGKGHMYWTDWKVNDKERRNVIGRANLDGSDQRAILNNIGRCGSITADVMADRIYWVNYDHRSVQSATLNGDDVQSLASDLQAPLSVNIYENYIYWYDLSDKVIRRINKINQRDITVIQTGIDSMINLLVVHGSRQKGWSKCATKNGGCEYFCFSTGNVRNNTRCGCPTHYLLNSDNITCSAPTNFLLLSERTESSSRDMQIKRIMDSSRPDLVLPMRSLRSVTALEYDSLANKIYWIVDTGKAKAIRRSSVDGSDLEVFIHQGLFSPSSMAIDPYGRRMFWVDTSSNVINVTTLNRGSVGVIYRGNGPNKPVDVVISPKRGYLFFITEADHITKNNKVLRINLDGTDIKTIVTGQHIAALTVDNESDRLYYSELGILTIKSCDLEGENGRTLVSDITTTSLTIYKDKLYYVLYSIQLFYVDKTSGNHRRKVIRGGDTGITDLHAVSGDSLTNRQRQPCAMNNGDCSHICYISPFRGKTCGCPEGLILNLNGLHCEPEPTCSSTDLRCSTARGTACIPYEWRCDGVEECDDGSDEKDCPTCPANTFTCGSGECLDKSRVCNRIADCTDSSDEHKCCRADEFMCAESLECIHNSKKGDGMLDCKDESDEAGPVSSRGAMLPENTNPYAVGIIVVLCIVSVFILFVIIFIVWKCHKRSNNLRYADPTMPSMLIMQARSADSIGTGTVMGDTMNMNIAQSVTGTTVISASPAPTSLGAYDRNHVTGASSSSSSMTHLQAGYNPPPSPVTERSVFIGRRHVMDADDCSTLVSSAYPSYHPHNRGKHNVKVPPTTPISTCDDSEPSLVNYAAHPRTRVKRKSNKKYIQLKPTYADGTEPFPPPPTPSRSQICSGDEGSECPPSPSTVRSYRSTTNNPYPPPPSPEPTSDNS